MTKKSTPRTYEKPAIEINDVNTFVSVLCASNGGTVTPWSGGTDFGLDIWQ